MHEPREMERAVALQPSYAHQPSFEFASPLGSVIGAERGAELHFERRTDVAREVMRALSYRARQLRERVFVAGALPFDDRSLPALRLQVRTQQPMDEAVRHSELFLTQRPARMTSVPTPCEYERAVAAAVARIRAGALRKVVLARALDLELGSPIDRGALMRRLRLQNPGKYVFSCDVAQPGKRVTLVGASPELLVEKRGPRVRSHPLAGSTPRSADVAEDRARAERLLDCEKNLREHALVVEAVGDTLARFCRDLHVPERPALVQTPTMWHLGSEIHGRLRDLEHSSLAIALALHPTPAVCGTPRERAAEQIAELEGFQRDYFAGCVGYCDATGDGEWAVTIRCAELSERTLRLYAGAGIVTDSTPADELAETSAKLRTMLRALGFEREIEGS